MTRAALQKAKPTPQPIRFNWRKPRMPESTCLCGAREADTGQERPRECWGCGKADGMGQFNSGGAMLGVGEGE